MPKKIPVRKAMVYLIFFILMIKQLYSYAGMGYTLIENSTYGFQQLPRIGGVTIALDYLALALLITLFLVEYPKIIRKLTELGMTALLVMTGAVVCWAFITLIRYGAKTVLYSETTPEVYLTILAVVVGVDDKLYGSFSRIALRMGVFSLAASLTSYLLFLSKHPSGLMGNTAALILYVQGFWLVVIGSIDYFKKRKKRAFICFLMTICMVLALLFNARSYVIQSLIWTLVFPYITTQKGKRGRFRGVWAAVVIGGLAFAFVANFEPHLFETFMEKTDRDTRSFQYIELFSQTNLKDFLIGQGYAFQYYSPTMGGFYSYIDNGYLFLMMRYGIMYCCWLWGFTTAFFTTRNGWSGGTALCLSCGCALSAGCLYIQCWSLILNVWPSQSLSGGALLFTGKKEKNQRREQKQMPDHKILYIIRCGLPESAAGIRVFQMARLLQKNGYIVDFLCADPVAAEGAANHGHDQQTGDRVYSYQGFRYFVPEPSERGRFRNLAELVTAERLCRRVKKHQCAEGYDVFVLYNDPGPLTWRLRKYCAQQCVQLIGDITEWYAPRSRGKIGERLMPLMVGHRIRRLDKCCLDGVIAVSPFLYDYYRRKGMKTIFIPPLMQGSGQQTAVKYHYYTHPVINLVYTGSPGEKDLLVPLFEAVEHLNRKKLRFRLDIAGVGEEYLKVVWKHGSYSELGIFAHGRVSREEALLLGYRADFCVLLRKAKRYARAGFSTKMAECMSSGTAMICNDVSGPEQLLVNGREGFVIAGLEELEAMLEKVAGMEQNRIKEIKEAAREKAKVLFSPAAYAAPLLKLMEKR